jgi:hypothetical protein
MRAGALQCLGAAFSGAGFTGAALADAAADADGAAAASPATTAEALGAADAVGLPGRRGKSIDSGVDGSAVTGAAVMAPMCVCRSGVLPASSWVQAKRDTAAIARTAQVGARMAASS